MIKVSFLFLDQPPLYFLQAIIVLELALEKLFKTRQCRGSISRFQSKVNLWTTVFLCGLNGAVGFLVTYKWLSKCKPNTKSDGFIIQIEQWKHNNDMQIWNV